ncbi:glycosyltransferase family 2 protein, partial [bacterium]|nr:glycosyltransferase family 2 protein [candidate division CSSED10-310 bacterium]
IVVDNGSGDGTAEMIAAHAAETRLIANSRNVGYCRGNNQGLAEARGRLVLLLNADAVPAPDALERLVTAFDSAPDTCIAVAPKVLYAAAPAFINSLGAHWHATGHWRDIRVGRLDLGGFPPGEQVFGCIFAAVMFHAARLRAIGGFDPRFFSYCEDFDTCYRANLAGYTIHTAPAAVIHHRYRAALATPARRRWHSYLHTRNYLMVFLKNFEAASLLRQAPRILRRYLLSPARVACVAEGPRALIPYLKAVTWLLLHLPGILCSRRATQRLRSVPDEELWTHGPVEERNLFQEGDAPVLSLLALRTARWERQEYEAGGKRYRTF